MWGTDQREVAHHEEGCEFEVGMWSGDVGWGCVVLTGERLSTMRKAVSVEWGCGVGMWGTDWREVAHHEEGCEFKVGMWGTDQREVAHHQEGCECGVGMWGTDRREVIHHQEGCECGVGMWSGDVGN